MRYLLILIIILAAASEPPKLPIPPLPEVMPRLNPYWMGD